MCGAVLAPERWPATLEHLGGLVAPPFTYGYKSHQKSGGGNHLPGTTSLDGATLVAALRDVMKEFVRHGARRLVLVNGHYENSWFIVEAIDLALRELRWDGIRDVKVVVLSYWDFVGEATMVRLYPEGFPGWAVEHGGVLETSLMLALHPQLVVLERAIDQAPASFPPYEVYPVHPEWTPPSGTPAFAASTQAQPPTSQIRAPSRISLCSSADLIVRIHMVAWPTSTSSTPGSASSSWRRRSMLTWSNSMPSRRTPLVSCWTARK
ncbi:creatininase [Benzoatithermus flavus]|uniref:creatininase n=1 Tax=Benzoatithermus flavus TaxID=3108223 RepID=UPI003AADAAED